MVDSRALVVIRVDTRQILLTVMAEGCRTPVQSLSGCVPYVQGNAMATGHVAAKGRMLETRGG